MASPLEMVEASCTGLVRRMVNLPRAISRALDHGLDVMRASGGRRNHHHQFPPPYHVPVQQHHQPPPLDQSFTTNLQPDWSFLAGFEQQFGVVHPFFYACRFVEALKMARDEEKLVFLYLHSPDHPFTPPFCKATLCSEVVVQFLDANFVSWGGGADSGDGLHMATTLRPASFPFCAVVAPCSADSLAVIQQIEGPVTPEELVEILQTMLEEQGLVFGNGRAKVEEKRMADLRLRQEGAAYSASLQADQKKEAKVEKRTQHQDNAIAQDAQILIRFPNGERKEKTFSCMDKIEAIFAFVDSLGLPGIGRNYRLVSSFPRKAYGVDQMDMTLKDAGIYPLATLFIELV
ncbi:plant UBX domain-containing protein 10-like [Cynara cardunculus var. scolymus]|uniref:plant UBX domain-containing protein 10-like n=1 Tax=Cynara cardunculus var. scolymus TaxID=59895 RepID=UPI000D62E42E|nr:plant UBX domain-containing protein 10-like [Cynara cardunculus var. scolymus]